MAVKDIIPKTNVKAVDIRDTLLAHGADWSTVRDNKSANYLPNYFKDEAMLAVWQRDRPHNSDVPYNDYDFFRKTVNRCFYRTGDVIPTDSFYTIIKDDGKLDFEHFKGYNPKAHAYITEMNSLPDNLNGSSSYFIPTVSVEGFENFIRYITNNATFSRWSTAMLLICERHGYESRYFLLSQRQYPTFVGRMGCNFNIFADARLNKIMRDVDISKYKCHALGVALPESHPYYSRNISEYKEVPAGVEFDLLPSCIYVEGSNITRAVAVKNNLSVSNPMGINNFSFTVYDTGDGRDYFIPDEEVFRYSIYYDGKLKDSSSSTIWKDLEGVILSDRFFIGGDVKKVNIEIEVPKKSIPVGEHGDVGVCEYGVGNFDKRVDDGLTYIFYWDREVNIDLEDPYIDCKLGITYFFDSGR